MKKKCYQCRKNGNIYKRTKTEQRSESANKHITKYWSDFQGDFYKVCYYCGSRGCVGDKV